MLSTQDRSRLADGSGSALRLLSAAVVFLIGATAASAADPGFPLRPGEWTTTTKTAQSAEPMVMLFCLNNETWIKAMTQNGACTMQQTASSSKGMSISLDCPNKAFQMKGTVDMSYDGMEHMVAKAKLAMTIDGKTTMSEATTDYRWKAAACSSEDMNMKKKSAH